MIRADQETSVRFSLWTLPWNRRVARRLELLGKKHGLTVSHEHDGGLTLRYHLIVASGESDEVRRYNDAVARWDRLTRGLPARPVIPEPLLRQFRNNTPEEAPDAPVD